MNLSTITPSTFLNVQQHYANNGNVVFVRGDHLFRLMSATHAPAQHKVWSGDFDGDKKSDALFYYGSNGDWWMGLSDGNKLTWHKSGNTATSYGNMVDGKHAFYSGDFNGDGKRDVLVYGNADGSWLLGASDGTNLNFSVINKSPGYGDLLDGTRRTFIGDFNGDGKSDVLFYYNGKGQFFLGTSTGTALNWVLADSHPGFGDLLDGGHTFFVGDFNGDGKSDLLFYYSGDGHLIMGLSDGATLTWHQAADASGYGSLLDPSRHLVQGDFNGDGKSDLLFYNGSDGYLWMGLSDGTNINWHQVAPRLNGNMNDWSHRWLVGDFDGDKKSDLAYYDSDDGSIWIGLSDGTNLTWHQASSVSMLGNLVDTDHLLFDGDYDGDGKSDLLDYAAGDGNWRMGLSDGSNLNWHVAVNTSGFGDLTH
jgi:hypothetical protein